ncbi:unnamed protein product [Rotaria magnacalcarata]|uniref:Uncharacterized protein n=1 Tax=Rotaria magnacalcarata TaxID=392030 RepID=A0A816QHV9_9BILA|nr:unnamed protein product [Rotaria magnacalcarata]CAF4030232.1 unnamed protein product [Rotaria magnacalcarata]
MATVISSYTPYMYHQQPYYYPTLPSVYSTQTDANNYYYPMQQPRVQPQQQQQQRQPTKVQYVDSGLQSLLPRRQPRIYREVIVLPTPEPIYRQVRRRLPTPERQVIQRTIVQKGNGDVIVREQRPKPKVRSHSRSEHTTQSRSSRSRQVHTD